MNISLISHDTTIKDTLESVMQKTGHHFVYYHDVSIALAGIEKHTPDVIFVDSAIKPADELEPWLDRLNEHGNHIVLLGDENAPEGYDTLYRAAKESSLRLKIGQLLERDLRKNSIDLHNLAGKTVGNYNIMYRLGEKTLNTVVYRATDTQHQRDVAIKFFSNVKAEESVIKRFKREADIAKKLDHENIYRVYGLEQLENGIPYLVMEFIDGQTLKDVFAEERLSLAQVLDYGMQIARGLASAHGQKITHRDIKPSNIMLMPDGVIKILDFGVAKVLEPTSSIQEQLTKHGMILGTMRYMAPEQIEGHAVDARADCWALGVILYEMLAGSHPFEAAQGILGLLNAILYDEPHKLERPDVPPLLHEILEDLLQKEPEKRYPSAWEVLEDLEDIEL